MRNTTTMTISLQELLPYRQPYRQPYLEIRAQDSHLLSQISSCPGILQRGRLLSRPCSLQAIPPLNLHISRSRYHCLHRLFSPFAGLHACPVSSHLVKYDRVHIPQLPSRLFARCLRLRCIHRRCLFISPLRGHPALPVGNRLVILLANLRQDHRHIQPHSLRSYHHDNRLRVHHISQLLSHR